MSVRIAAYETLMEKLEEIGVSMVDFHRLSIEESAYLEVFFDSEILPLLSPHDRGKTSAVPISEKPCDLCSLCVTDKERKRKKNSASYRAIREFFFPELCPAGSVVCVPSVRTVCAPDRNCFLKKEFHSRRRSLIWKNQSCHRSKKKTNCFLIHLKV